ncbi:MAG: VanZ family protein [Candidatus Moranbacteria bacterium]|nr:VanZ family protein [Candidatus Moranbacteria bacterium]
MKQNALLNNKRRLVLYYYLPLLLWMGIIFYFSSLSGSADAGSRDFWFYAQRKGAHFFEYVILAVFWLRIFRMHYFYQKTELYHWAFFASLLYAISDEIHQVFVAGREGKILDVGIDALGILAGLVIWNLFLLWRNWRNKKLPAEAGSFSKSE